MTTRIAALLGAWVCHGAIAATAVDTVPGMPPVADAANLYSEIAAGKLSEAVKGHLPRVYVPNRQSNDVWVYDPVTLKVIEKFKVGINPQHVVPSWDLKTLWVANNAEGRPDGTLTPIDPTTGKPGASLKVDDPYNMYFTPDGRYAIVVAEARQNLDFRDPHTFALRHRIHVNCAGVDHIDFAATGAYLIATCEFGGRLVRIDLHTLKVVGYLNLPGSAPQDIKLDPAGRIFYVADKNHGGVWLVNAATFRLAGFIPTGPDAHGLYPNRDARLLYVTNRGTARSP